MGLQCFSAFAVDALLKAELFAELPSVRVAGATLDQATKDFALILERLSGVEGWWDSVGNCISSPTRRLLPVANPC